MMDLDIKVTRIGQRALEDLLLKATIPEWIKEIRVSSDEIFDRVRDMYDEHEREWSRMITANVLLRGHTVDLTESDGTVHVLETKDILKGISMAVVRSHIFLEPMSWSDRSASTIFQFAVFGEIKYDIKK